MIFCKKQWYLTTRITYTIRKLIESAITAITNRTRLLLFIFFSKKKREKVTAVMAEPWKIRIRKIFGNQSNHLVTKVTEK